MTDAGLSRAHLRVARPSDDLDAVLRFYRDGLGFAVLGSFEGHSGFDGVMLGHPEAAYHLEFTRKKGHRAGKAPTQDNLLVFYLPDRGEWQAAVDRLLGLGHRPVQSFNPYWDRGGKTFGDPDGYRVVLHNAAWPASAQVAAAQQDDDPRGTAELLAAYEAGTGVLRTAVAGMSLEQLRSRPVEGKWSTLEVLCHVSDCEQFFADRMKRTLAMDRPLLVGADGWRYPEAAHYHDRDPAEELALVELTRRQMARILQLVPEQAWRRTAVHTEAGQVTLRQLLLHAICHLEHHVGFIQQKRAALGLPPKETPGNPHEVGRRGDLLVSTDPALLDLGVIHRFLADRSYWAAGRPLEVVRRSLANSLCFGLYEAGRQVGLARVVTDRATFAWLCDVFVLEPYRDRGLGKWLVECVLGHPALQGLRRFLLGTRDAHGLYRRFGFSPLADPTRFLEVIRPGESQAGHPADESAQAPRSPEAKGGE
jgi:uncharacterized damage-inducible protein DinB/GNAT superfamily N-acetyltransferase